MGFFGDVGEFLGDVGKGAGDWLFGTGDPSMPASTYRFGGGPAGAALQKQMAQRASGQGVSAAEQQMREGLARQVAAGSSMAASARGVSPGLAMRQAGRREAQAMSAANQQMGILRAQEQTQAQQQLARWLAEQDRLRFAQEQFNISRPRDAGMLGSLLGTAGTVVGAIYGGPGGAVAGREVGEAAGSAVSGGYPTDFGGF